MSYKYRQKPEQQRKSDPDRWNSVDPDAVTTLAQVSINMDLAALHDWFMQCKRQYPSVFRGWSIEQFKNWNDQRIADLIDNKPGAALSTAETRKRMWERSGKRIWNPDTKQLEPSQWNDATGDFELIPAA